MADVRAAQECDVPEISLFYNEHLRRMEVWFIWPDGIEMFACRPDYRSGTLHQDFESERWAAFDDAEYGEVNQVRADMAVAHESETRVIISTEIETYLRAQNLDYVSDGDDVRLEVVSPFSVS